MPPKKKGPGRPPLPRGRDRSEMLVIRLRPDERRSVDAAARLAGQTVSEFVRSRILDGLK